MFRFEVPAPVYLGVGSRLEVLPVLRANGFRRLGVVIDGGIASQSVFSDFLEKDVPASGLEIALLFVSRGDREPDYDYLDHAAEGFREVELDGILGIGGGSAMDLAKGVAILATNPGRGMDYRGVDRVEQPGVPTVLFPTTAGTGSEVTKTASFVDPVNLRKMGINGRHVAAWAGVLDPELTLDCPAAPTMSAGLDALVHTVESFTAVTSSPLARENARSAFPRLFNNLWRVLENPQDLESRYQMLLGSHLAGIAMWNAAGGGPASGISYPIGSFHGVPHGFAGGVLLPHVIRHNVMSGYKGYEPLYHLVEDVDPNPAAGVSRAFAETFEALYERIDAPRDFGRWGITHESGAAIVEETLTNRAANLTHNPIPFGRAEVQQLVQEVTVSDSKANTRSS